MSAHAIEIRGLHKKFGTFTLGPLDLTVPEGAVYGFVGPNGAGKTTTINLIMGMGAADAGAISVHGCDHARDDLAMKRLVGYASPELNFRPWGRVGRVIRFVRGFYPSWDQKYCGHLLETFSVGADERISALSLGARTKLALVLAMSWRPRVLVLDEPTVGLDPIARRQLFAELLAAVQDEGRTVFISSHSVSDLERFADHIGMIKQGRLVLEGSTADITERCPPRRAGSDLPFRDRAPTKSGSSGSGSPPGSRPGPHSPARSGKKNGSCSKTGSFNWRPSRSARRVPAAGLDRETAISSPGCSPRRRRRWPLPTRPFARGACDFEPRRGSAVPRPTARLASGRPQRHPARPCGR
jgi:ABC-2 type transport system ATP-binding protein